MLTAEMFKKDKENIQNVLNLKFQFLSLEKRI